MKIFLNIILYITIFSVVDFTYLAITEDSSHWFMASIGFLSFIAVGLIIGKYDYEKKLKAKKILKGREQIGSPQWPKGSKEQDSRQWGDTRDNKST